MDEEKKARKERMKEYRRRYREKHGIPEQPKRWRKAAVTAVVVCLAGVGSFFAAQSQADAKVTLDGQPVQDMSSDDMEAYLKQHEENLKGQRLALTGQDIKESLDLEKLDVSFDRDYINDEIHLTGRRGTPWQRVAEVVSVLQHGKDVPLAMQVNESKLNDVLDEMAEAYGKPPQNAYAHPLTDQVSVAVEKEKPQIMIDKDALRAEIEGELHRGTTQDVDVPVISREEALVKAADLQEIDRVLSYYTTHFDNTNPDRNDNIRLAQRKLNHALVPAQKDFSFNTHVGERTREAGYKDAPVYFDNKLVPDAGGGVCQVSTTLFNAALRAGLFIASRAPHFAPAAYVPVGMDATVADHSLDFAFTNPFRHAVYIYTVIGENTITTYILGNHADVCTVSFQTTGLANLPHQVIFRHDNETVQDTRQQEGYDGHDIVIHRSVVYADGDTYSDDIRSHYAPNDEIILTAGADASEMVQTSDLEAQDVLINAPHDMYEAVALPAAEEDSEDGESEE